MSLFSRFVGLLTLVAVLGCAGNQLFTGRTLPSNGLPPDAALRVQFFVSPGFSLSASEQTKDSRKVSDAALHVSQEREDRSIIVTNNLPGVAISEAASRMDVDVGRPNSLVAGSLVLTFSPEGKSGAYTLREINRQAISGPVTLDGWSYKVVTSGPVFLKFKLGSESKIVRKDTKVPGRRVGSP